MKILASKKIFLIAGIYIFIALVTLLALRWLYHASAPHIGGEPVIVEVAKGETLGSVATKLDQLRLVPNRWSFILAARINRAERRIRPGRYLMARGMSNVEVLRELVRGRAATVTVTIPEGLRLTQIAGIFSQRMAFDSSRFVEICSDGAFIRELGFSAPNLEGYLFPDTYEFFAQSSPETIIRKMTANLKTVFHDTLNNRLKQLGLSLHQCITLASIIQGEVMVWEEAPLVSAVYHNRLRRRIPLAADPTIQYLLTDGPRRLYQKDLELDSPYNTYRRLGLPPGPINNPGRQAIIAALYPADVDYLFFVARGDGTHSFNTTHAGHLADKELLQQIRRRVARDKRQNQALSNQ